MSFLFPISAIVKGPTVCLSNLYLLGFSQERRPTGVMEELFPELHRRSRFQWFNRFTGVDWDIQSIFLFSNEQLIVPAADNAAEQTSALNPLLRVPQLKTTPCPTTYPFLGSVYPVTVGCGNIKF